MDRTYYQKYYDFERQHWWFRARRQILSDYIADNMPLQPDARILNIGAATGASSEMLMQHGKVTSLEYDQECIDSVREKLSYPIEPGNILDLNLPDAQVDLACAFDVIEHVEQDDRAVAEMLRVCKPGAHVLVTVPALMCLWSEHDIINHHFRRYTKQTLAALLGQFPNCRVQYLTYFNTRLFPVIYLIRRISSLRKPNPDDLKSDCDKFQPGLANRALQRIFYGESSRIRRQGRERCFGVSILAHCVKEPSE